MGYKTTERYGLGWTDPRAMFGNRDDRRIRLDEIVRTSLGTVPTETLRNLWLVTWGAPTVDVDSLAWENAANEVVEVVQELSNRSLVTLRTNENISTQQRTHYYVLSTIYADS